MRLGINMPFTGSAGEPLDAAGLMDRARMVEQAGLDGIWLQDSMIPGVMRPDALMWLLTAAAGTTTLELGTCIYIVPIHHPVDLAQRFLTLQALTNSRVTLGVGTGSRRESHESMGTDFDTRFSRLHSDMDTIRRLCAGETVGAANLNPWAEVRGGPRFALGAWHSETSLRRAATQFDGWLCSAGRTSFNTMKEAVKLYRDLGGTRAIVSTTWIDLFAPTEKMTDDDPYHLRCAPVEAADRLQRLVGLGFDDVLLMHANHSGGVRRRETDFAFDELCQIRELLPKDDRRPWHERGLNA